MSVSTVFYYKISVLLISVYCRTWSTIDLPAKEVRRVLQSRVSPRAETPTIPTPTWTTRTRNTWSLPSARLRRKTLTTPGKHPLTSSPLLHPSHLHQILLIWGQCNEETDRKFSETKIIPWDQLVDIGKNNIVYISHKSLVNYCSLTSFTTF